jgi:hypothetical protein
MYANRPGPGSHVASGSLMVAKQARGKGVGRALTTDMIRWARRSGFAAIQFNAVVDTNTAVVHLYERLGLVTVGTAPGAFRHPTAGPVGLRIMWLDLRHPANATPLTRPDGLIATPRGHMGGIRSSATCTSVAQVGLAPRR